eukprot:PhM_4_TR8342/c0_g1_i1/m.17908
MVFPNNSQQIKPQRSCRNHCTLLIVLLILQLCVVIIKAEGGENTTGTNVTLWAPPSASPSASPSLPIPPLSSNAVTLLFLQRLYTATTSSGPGLRWKNSFGWDRKPITTTKKNKKAPATTTIHVCRWFGVECLSTGQTLVYALRLKGNNLVGTLPEFSDVFPSSPSSAAASDLRIIDLSSNSLSGTIPSSWFNTNVLGNLEQLILSQNQLSQTIPWHDGLLRSPLLFHIDVSQNLLTGTLPAVSPSAQPVVLLRLRLLRLRQNYFVGPIPHSFLRVVCPQIEVFDLSRNSFRDHLISVFEAPSSVMPSQFSSISYLDLSSNLFYGDLPGPVFADRLGPSLQSLNLSKNILRGTISNWMAMSGLRDLVLNSNEISGTLPRELWGAFPNLRVLDVGRNHFRGPAPEESVVALSTQLSYLDLSQNSFIGLLPAYSSSANKVLLLRTAMNSWDCPLPNISSPFSSSLSFSSVVWIDGPPSTECVERTKVAERKRQRRLESQKLSTPLTPHQVLGVNFGIITLICCAMLVRVVGVPVAVQEFFSKTVVQSLRRVISAIYPPFKRHSSKKKKRKNFEENEAV